MIQALNYTPKAIDFLKARLAKQEPFDRMGLTFIIEKLRAAQVFILPDYGQLMDRSAPRPEVPETVFRPPYPVTAVEFPASSDAGRSQGEYTVMRSSRRIALAWDWPGGYPFQQMMHGDPGPGVGIASVCYMDATRTWSVMPLAAHVSYEHAWAAPATTAELTPYVKSALDHGRMSKRVLEARRLKATPMPMLPNHVTVGIQTFGPDTALDAMHADLDDEFNAYLDMCSALACRNVSTERHPAAKALNRERVRNGKAPHVDWHILKLRDAEMGGMAGIGGGSDRRAHLRRGHVRRLSPERITWVNQTMVRGHGFLDKAYAL